MKYILLIYANEALLDEVHARGECAAEGVRIAHELDAAGQYIAAAPLRPTNTATSVRVRDGKPLVTDGPFAETREQLGGYYLIDVPDLDDAIRVATRISGAQFGTVEIRPVVELAGLPPGPRAAARDARAGAE